MHHKFDSEDNSTYSKDSEVVSHGEVIRVAQEVTQQREVILNDVEENRQDDRSEDETAQNVC